MQITEDDLIEYGMIPEFVGRLPIIAPLLPLSAEDLMRIVTEPRNALARQYQEYFRMEECEIDYTPEGLRELAERALKRDTGARALRAILEDLMLDPMFELPGLKKRGTFVLTPEVVRGEKRLLDSFVAARATTAKTRRRTPKEDAA